MNEEINLNEAELVDKWHKKLSRAEEFWRPFHELVEETREYYKNQKNKNKHNIFWAAVEIMKPFLYFKQPRPYVDRKEKNADPVISAACRIVENALMWDLEQFDFDSVVKYARNDFLISGMGVLEEKYEAELKHAEIGGEIGEIKASERVVTDYFDPVDFLADSEKVGIWEEADWVARKIWMTKQEVIDAFGEEVRDLIVDPGDNDYKGKDTLIYKIWDKTSKKIYWISKECEIRFLKISEDMLKLQGFLPLPKPIFATQSNDAMVPVPDYSEIKSLLDELDGVTSRMRMTMKAFKVSGAYDRAFPELGNILNKDVTLVAVDDFDKLRDVGGLRGVIDFAPIEQYLNVLRGLAERRQQLKTELFEISGVSDIMRGNSDPNETATAVRQKTNFGSLRNQDRQNDMQRFLTDLFKIKAEIICERFSDETLAAFLPQSDAYPPEVIVKAVLYLKEQKLRGMILGIETDTAFNQEAEARKAMETVKSINDMIKVAFEVLSAQPLLLPLYKQMIMSVVVTLPNARQFQSVIEQTFAKIEQQIAMPKPPLPNPKLLSLQNQAQKNMQEFAVMKEKNIIKGQELALKKQIADDKVAMQNKEAEMQFALKQEKIAIGQPVTANISTGYVRGF